MNYEKFAPNKKIRQSNIVKQNIEIVPEAIKDATLNKITKIIDETFSSFLLGTILSVTVIIFYLKIPEKLVKVQTDIQLIKRYLKNIGKENDDKNDEER